MASADSGWLPLMTCLHWIQGVQAAQSYTDNGDNPAAAWRAVGGGDAHHRRKWRCKRHQCCAVMIMLKGNIQDGFTLMRNSATHTCPPVPGDGLDFESKR